MSIKRKKLVKKLDKVFKDYIKLRDNWTCCICGKRKEWGIVIDAGHLITCASYATRWDEKNVFAQCRNCNYTHEFRPELMTNWYLEKFGAREYELLTIKSRKPPKFSDFDLEIMVKIYTKKLKELKNESSKSSNRI